MSKKHYRGSHTEFKNNLLLFLGIGKEAARVLYKHGANIILGI